MSGAAAACSRRASSSTASQRDHWTSTARLSGGCRLLPRAAGPIFPERHALLLGLRQLGRPRLLANDQAGGLLRNRARYLGALRLERGGRLLAGHRLE